jgi:hypothetical protein
MTEKKEAAPPKLAPPRLRGAEYERTVHVVTIEPNTKDHITDPGFWSLVSTKFKPMDKIEVRSDDGTFYAEGLILACDRSWAKVYILHEHNLTTPDVAQTEADQYEVKFRGPHHKWSVLRGSDVIMSEMPDKESALKWLAEHKKVVA